MAGHNCHNCMYSVCDPELWDRQMWVGEPILARCANHPQWPGQLHDVPGVPCPNYRPKPVLPGGDDVRLIPLGDGFYAYVDAPDYEWLSRYTWHMENGYPSRREKGKRIYMHRQIMQAPRNMVVDHIDGNRTNASRFNLRVCTPGENHRNQRKQAGSRSRFKGVFYDKRLGKWFARCGVRGQVYWLGYFDEEIEAARAYDRKALEVFGEFAHLNFPEARPPRHRPGDALSRPNTQGLGPCNGGYGRAAAHHQERSETNRDTGNTRGNPMGTLIGE
jgi:hypothetical protein